MAIKVAVVMTIGRSFNPAWFSYAQDSVVEQDRIDKDFDLVLICVTQGDLDLPNAVEGLARVHVSHPWNEGDGITVMEQTKVGYDTAREFGANYICKLDADDAFFRNSMALLLSNFDDDDVWVSYGDIVKYNEDMTRARMYPISARFDVRTMLGNHHLPNIIPDHSMFRAELLDIEPFDPSLRCASYRLWWLKTWDRLGEGFAFEHCGSPFYRQRVHDLQISGTEGVYNPWKEEGDRIALNWLKTWHVSKELGLREDQFAWLDNKPRITS